MKIKTALKAVVVAASLMFAGASHAEIHYGPAEMAFVSDDGAKLLNPLAEGVQAVTVYDLTGTSLGNSILAFCIQPIVPQRDATAYTENNGAILSDWFPTVQSGLNRSALIQKLFESSYGSLFGADAEVNSTNRLGFQLALWDLIADDGDIYGGAHQAFTADLADPIVAAANTMLHATPAGDHYSYTVFTGVSPDGLSQNLISVTAVPEADTWAMLVAGLGMIGFMGRRRSKQSEKFAA